MWAPSIIWQKRLFDGYTDPRGNRQSLYKYCIGQWIIQAGCGQSAPCYTTACVSPFYHVAASDCFAYEIRYCSRAKWLLDVLSDRRHSRVTLNNYILATPPPPLPLSLSLYLSLPLSLSLLLHHPLQCSDSRVVFRHKPRRMFDQTESINPIGNPHRSNWTRISYIFRLCTRLLFLTFFSIKFTRCILTQINCNWNSIRPFQSDYSIALTNKVSFLRKLNFG